MGRSHIRAGLEQCYRIHPDEFFEQADQLKEGMTEQEVLRRFAVFDRMEKKESEIWFFLEKSCKDFALLPFHYGVQVSLDEEGKVRRVYRFDG